MQQIYELQGQGRSIRAIAQTLGLSRNSVRKYLRAEAVPQPKPRPRRATKLDPYHDYVQTRLSAGVENCVLLLRELRAQGYPGGITMLKAYVHPARARAKPATTVRFETQPGEQAQVDFGYFTYLTPDGRRQQRYAFVMVLSWSRALYVEFIRRADVASFLRCHVHAFEHFGGVPQRCLYDNTKVVVLERTASGEPVFTPRFLDFSLRVGFGIQLCRPYRPQTKGRVESGVKYVRGNFWPGARFVDDADLHRQAQTWAAEVADRRVHGTTHERPVERLAQERPRLGALPGRDRLLPWLREERKVGRDGFVQWEQAWYGVAVTWAGRTVQVQSDAGTVEIFGDEQRLAVHPCATRPGQRFTAPRQWEGLQTGETRPPREGLAVQVPTLEVAQRSLAVYEVAAVGGPA